MLDPLKILAHHTCSLCPIMFSLPSLPKHANSFILSKLLQLIQLSLILLFLEKEAFLCIPLRKNVPYQWGCLFHLLASRQLSSYPVISKDIQGEIPTDSFLQCYGSFSYTQERWKATVRQSLLPCLCEVSSEPHRNTSLLSFMVVVLNCIFQEMLFAP